MEQKHPPFKTKPFQHQLTELEAHWNDEARAIFWEQGTGKSKLIIDTAARMFHAGMIDALFVVAPNGVHENWTEKELPAHYPGPFYAATYRTSKKNTKAHEREMERVLGYRDGLTVLTMSYDALLTDHGKRTAKRWLTKRRCLYVLDESTRIKSPGAKRTKTILASAKYAPFRRILTGTPVANGPFDVWAPMKFLDPAIWDGRGWRRFGAFKGYFGIFRKGYNGNTKREFKQLVGYRYLDKLVQILDPHSSRVTKDEVLDLPPKLYTTLSFDLSPQEQRVYDDMRDEYRVLLETGEKVTATLAMKRLLRLQQIASGYLPLDDSDEVVPLPNPSRLKLLRELVQDVSNSTIIWARFRKDIDQIMDLLADLKLPAVRYDGSTKEEARLRAVDDFQAGKASFFVANPAAAGEGLTLHAARTVIYYTNSFNLTDRLQSEDRAHRIGQEHPVQYIDLVAAATVDKHIVRALRKKLDIARLITGDQMKEWL